jgi:hypothetical protein
MLCYNVTNGVQCQTSRQCCLPPGLNDVVGMSGLRCVTTSAASKAAIEIGCQIPCCVVQKHCFAPGVAAAAMHRSGRRSVHTVPESVCGIQHLSMMFEVCEGCCVGVACCHALGARFNPCTLLHAPASTSRRVLLCA